MSDFSGNRIKRSRITSPWRYRFEIDGHPYAGSTETTNKADAEAFAAARFKEESETANKERQLGNAPMTFGTSCDKWLAGAAIRLREQGLTEQVAWLKKQIGPGKLLQGLRRDDISEMVAARAQCLRPGKAGTKRRVADGTVNKTLRLMSRIINYAEARHDAVVKRFLWKDFFIKQPKARPAKRAISETTEQIIFGNIHADYIDICRFAVIGSLRASENLLLWEQIDWDNAVALNVVGKGHREGRDVPLGRAEMAILRHEFGRDDRHVTHVFTRVARRTGKIPRTNRVQIKGQRYPITYSGWASEWEQMQADTGLTTRIHDLRHTAITRAIIRTGGNVPAAQAMAGHADIKTTMLYFDGDVSAVRSAKDVQSVPTAVPAVKKVG